MEELSAGSSGQVFTKNLRSRWLTKDCDIAGVWCTHLQASVQCHHGREQAYRTVVANRKLSSMRLGWLSTIHIERDRLGIRMTLSGVGFSENGCGDLTPTRPDTAVMRQSETCVVPDFDSRGFAVHRPRKERVREILNRHELDSIAVAR